MNTHEITQLSRDEVIARFGAALESPKVGDLVLRVTSSARDPIGSEGDVANSLTITVLRIDGIEGDLLKGTEICEFDGDDDTSQAREIDGTCEFQISELATSLQQRLDEDRRFWE